MLPPGQPPYRSDRYAVLTTGENGQFEFRGLPPGDYRLFAWEDVDNGAWFNSRFVSLYDRDSISLVLTEGQTRELEIVAIPAGR